MKHLLTIGFVIIIASAIAFAAVRHPAEQIAPGIFGVAGIGDFSFMNTSVGINKTNPASALDVTGTIASTGLRVVDGNQAAGKVLTSDASGNANWGPGASIPTGTMWIFTGASAPSGWVLCDGSAISRTTYADLYAVIGTTYGAGDGVNTFNVPDMRGRAPIGVGTGTGGGASGTGLPTGGSALTARSRGSWLGEETHTLTIAEMPSHTHTRPAFSWLTVPGSGPRGTYAGYENSDYTGYTGSNSPHNNIQPVMGVNFIIKT